MLCPNDSLSVGSSDSKGGLDTRDLDSVERNSLARNRGSALVVVTSVETVAWLIL